MAKEPKTYTHRELCDIGARWCKRTASQNGHGCNITIVEGCAIGENADAIGFRHSTYDGGSVLVEVKVSRSDFLADKGKPHRAEPHTGMGKWRYYLCPEGIISIEDLPPQWGLIHISPGGRLKVLAGAMAGKPNWKERDLKLKEWAFPEYNIINEQTLLIKNLSRFDDFDEMVSLQREANRSSSKAMQLQDEIRELKSENATLRSTSKMRFRENIAFRRQLRQANITPDEGIEFYSTNYSIQEYLDYKSNLELYSRSDRYNPELIEFLNDEIGRIYIRQAEQAQYSIKMRFGVNLPIDLILKIHKDYGAYHNMNEMSESDIELALSRKVFEVGPNGYRVSPHLKGSFECYLTPEVER